MTNLELEDIRLVAELPYAWEKFNNKTIMISGGTGFIGSFIIEVFRYRNNKYNSNIKIISLSRKTKESDTTVEYVQCDIQNKIKYINNVDYIIHLASNTHPRQYAEDPVGTITTNVSGCNNLLKFAVEHKIDRFLLASSVEIYGEGNGIPMDELYSGYINCNEARSGYNESKRTCEALCRAYGKQYGVDSVTVRLARVFGADSKRDSKAISQFMEKAVLLEAIILKSKGSQRFSFCYVADAASAIIKVLLDGMNGESYNVAEDDEGLTLGDYANIIAGFAGKKVIYEIEADDSVSKSSYAVLNTEKLKQICWKPIFNISGALNRTYKIYKEGDFYASY